MIVVCMWNLSKSSEREYQIDKVLILSKHRRWGVLYSVWGQTTNVQRISNQHWPAYKDICGEYVDAQEQQRNDVSDDNMYCMASNGGTMICA